MTTTLKLVAVSSSLLALLTELGMPALAAEDAWDTTAPVIRGVEVNGRPLAWHSGAEVKLATFPRNLVFNIGVPTNSAQKGTRLRTKLEGIDRDWQEVGGQMFVTIRFFNKSGDLVSQKEFAAHGESPGWNGNLETSTFTHRREVFSAPLDAAQMWVVLSSAGGPTAVGIYAVDHLMVSKITTSNGAPEILLRSPSPQELGTMSSPNQAPVGWERDGTRPSMARILDVGQNSSTKALAILDDDPLSHAEWHNTRAIAAPVAANENLLVEWNEMYTIGASMDRTATYASLPPGSYKFRVAEVSVLGKPTGVETMIVVTVPLPYWQTMWFWAALAVLTVGTSALSVRYLAWHKMRREVIRLEQQRALERERLRIAQDIHDDLGARVTEISLLSGMAENNDGFSEQARVEFCRISMKSRDLVAALYETVWAVNPENDNLEAIGNYLRQTINNQCTQAQLRCRLHISPLPRNIETSSRIRHNISMAAREATHNAIKHAKASQITVHVSVADMLLTVSIQDDGCGFDFATNPSGNGLVNMRRRMEDIGGNCVIESWSGRGTKVQFCLLVPALIKDFDRTESTRPAPASNGAY
jgi:signal transduction histidine kinase